MATAEWKETKRAIHFVLVPFPAQGHVTPMLHLARNLNAQGFVVTLATPGSIHRRLVARAAAAHPAGSTLLRFASIPSGLDADDAPKDMTAMAFPAILKAEESDMPTGLRGLLLQLSDSGKTSSSTTPFMVVDLLASWAMPVAAEFDIPVAGFWPGMLATYRLVSSIPELRRRGLISDCGIPVGHQLSDEHPSDTNQGQALEEIMQLADKGKLNIKHLPWLVGDSASQMSRFAFWLQVLERAKGLRWLLVNSFAGEGGDEPAQRPPDSEDTPRIFPVGSLLACNITGDSDTTSDHRLPTPGCNISSMWEEDYSCLQWLERHPPNSVLYVSFGTWVAPPTAEQITELALGLEATGRPFLWALKEDAAWRAGLPDGYLSLVEGKGKVVAWAPQEKVLRHAATGCYLTHCGWNSTLEAIRHQKKLLCYPVSGDQFINCSYIVDVWRVGATPEGFDRNAISSAIEKIMGGYEGEIIQGRMMDLKKQVMGRKGIAEAAATFQCFIQSITYKLSKL